MRVILVVVVGGVVVDRIPDFDIITFFSSFAEVPVLAGHRLGQLLGFLRHAREWEGDHVVLARDKRLAGVADDVRAGHVSEAGEARHGGAQNHQLFNVRFGHEKKHG